jgi:hypothetical protein
MINSDVPKTRIGHCEVNIVNFTAFSSFSRSAGLCPFASFGFVEIPNHEETTTEAK